MAAGLAIGFTAVRPPLKQALGVNILNYQKSKWVFSSLAFSSSSSSTSRKLILYSKPGCCLCDGLKEKLNAAFSFSSPQSLHDIQLQVLPLKPLRESHRTSKTKWDGGVYLDFMQWFFEV